MEKRFENVYMKRFLYFNLYVIKGIDGDVLIDTGFIFMKKRINRWLKQFNIKLIILTHAHADHIWNAAYLKEKYNCEIAFSNIDIENIDNSKIKSLPLKPCYQRWTKLMNFGMRNFHPKKFDIDILLENNQIIDKYGIPLKIISLAGHTKGSIGISYNNYLFAGDSLVYRKKYPEIAYQNQNNEKAYLSYKKILNLSPEIIFVGHDKPISIESLKEYKN